MPKIAYIDRKFSEASLVTIEQANDIIQTYQAQGFQLTLRQLYYQFVSRALIANKQTEYKRLGSVVNDGRLAGLIDWDAIEDRTRELDVRSKWDTPGDIIKSAADSYHIDLWQGQDTRPEVWIEKDALEGVIRGVCEELDVAFFSCRGYASQTSLWDAGQRLRRIWNANQFPRIIHLGDHDPSGIDMTRDIGERVSMFMGRRVDVDRIALTMDQVQQYNPPPNFAKDTDARFAGYQAEYGDESWELDALEPQVLSDLVREAIEDVMNRDLFEERQATEEAEKTQLELVSEKWEEVVEFVGNGGMDL